MDLTIIKQVGITKDNYKYYVSKWVKKTDLNDELIYCPDNLHDYVIYDNVFKYAFEKGILVKFENIPGTPYGKLTYIGHLSVQKDDV